MAEGLRRVDHGDWLELRLARPARRNALDRATIEALAEAVEAAARRPGLRALVLRGDGGRFCAGQDLNERYRRPGEPAPDLGAALRGGLNRVVAGLAALPAVAVAVVEGVAAGAGAGLALACDLALMAEEARLSLPFARLGLVPDTGLTWYLPRRAGRARAMGLALLGGEIGGAEAAAWGLVWQAVPQAGLDEALEALLGRLRAVPAGTVQAVKRALRAAETQGLGAQLRLEAALQAEAGRSAFYREAVAAFIERRREERR
ncbi:enoyl-CoA hydratase-related protein [Inmirania thermothiophila]|uniref:2-(1,2-epoxy-1,2-dihydrophenyl)acetyl-CoA isomerase n=1 Tax=Inmirania thermothiophila TaxID=1750597 RepID=A0A3N1Y0Z4_9GAMM|nr:enoyl-CoA hydratase-related protein [Inmirania thermothiophila]ROR32460.1 2-(1,2-epoxy-1,2-dihydrophenyl)acetyl-CoA isomerase [Inmirania thermothiophila]